VSKLEATAIAAYGFLTVGAAYTSAGLKAQGHLHSQDGAEGEMADAQSDLPADRQERRRRSLRPLARLAPYLARYKDKVAGALFFLVLAAATTLSLPLAVRRMIERRVDGVAILTFGMEDSLIQDLRFRRVPLVFVDVGPHVAGVSNIRINYQHGIRQAVQHLAALRHSRIAFITGPLHLKSALARKHAFETAMHEIGLMVSPELIVVGDHTMEGGMRAVVELSGLQPRPTAVLCSNDMTAIGVMREAYEYGIGIPKDLSVVGFDDIRLSQFTIPPLTTVQMSQTLLAEFAFKALMTEVESKSMSETGREYELITSLVLRGSTALAPSQEPSPKAPIIAADRSARKVLKRT